MAESFSKQKGTGGPASIINPHNPEFLVKKPWYLGGDGSSAPTLDHQTDQRPDTERVPLSLQASEHLLELQREKIARDRSALKFQVGMWVEAMKKNKPPFIICQIIKIAGGGTLFDLRYEDGTIERSVSMLKEDRGTARARIRITGAGSRAQIDGYTNDATAVPHAATLGKETYDSKRDRYHGFDAGASYMQRMEDKFGSREAIRRKIRSQIKAEENDTTQSQGAHDGKEKQAESDSDSDYDSDQGSSDSDDEFVQHDKDATVHTSRIARQGGVGGAEMKITARNLRIREDTAKYLRNLDPNSAFYDPKSRSMRDNPNPNMEPSDVPFAGDNFARISGDAIQLAKTQVFAWDLAQKQEGAGTTDDALAVIHPQANPSQAELLRKQHENIQVETKKEKRQAILSKYGGVQYLDDDSDVVGNAGNANLTTAATSSPVHTIVESAEERKTRFGVNFSEPIYSRDGKVVRSGAGVAVTPSQTKYVKLKSKYEEDIYINGHTTVFGSYFHRGAFRWGYADDHSLLRNSYCTGINGRIANDEANEWKYGNGVAGSAALAQARELLKNAPVAAVSSMHAQLDSGDRFDPAKIRATLRKQREEEDESDTNHGSLEKKRGYSALSH